MSLYIHCISHTFTTHTLPCLSNHTYLVCQPFTWDVYDFNLRLQVVQPRIVYLGLCVLRRDPEPSLKLGLCLLMQVRSVRVYAGRVWISTVIELGHAPLSFCCSKNWDCVFSLDSSTAHSPKGYHHCYAVQNLPHKSIPDCVYGGEEVQIIPKLDWECLQTLSTLEHINLVLGSSLDCFKIRR